ncbi:hypothetical protein Tco_1570817 [Tanacetum coccineum]
MVKQYQKEVNEIRAKKIAKNANPLALIATAQPHQASKSHKSYAPTSKTSLPTRSHATTRHKGKVIAKPITLLSESVLNKDNDHDKAQKLRNAKKFGTHYKNDNQTGQFGNQRTINVAEARETVGGQVVQQSGIQFFNYTDEEIDEQELEAHYSYMEKIQEVPTADSGTDSEPLEHNDQNAVECDDERVVLANLITNLKIDVDENKKIQKQLKKANTTLAHELTECKSILAETSRTLGESNSIWDSCLVALQNKQTEFERYKTLNDRTVDYEKLEHKFRLLAQKDIDIKEGLKLKAYEISVVKAKHDELVKQSLLTKSHYEGLVKEKTKNDSFTFVHELKQEMHADLKYVESLEKEIDELEYDKAEFSNMSDMLLQECMSNDVMCSYLHSLSDLDAHTELQCLYLYKVKECNCLAQKLSKQTKSVSKEV